MIGTYRVERLAWVVTLLQTTVKQSTTTLKSDSWLLVLQISLSETLNPFVSVKPVSWVQRTFPLTPANKFMMQV